jgi:predicted HTH transcriptional regulator
MTRVYDSPAGDITFEAVSEFVESALSTDLLTESLTLELKRQRSGTNVVDAVAAMANTDGGLVLVGIANEGAFADRFTGMSQSQHLALVDQLRSLLSGQMPEVIPVRIPDSDLLIVVIRIDADQFETPVVVGGRVLVRAPGQSVPADRERVVALSRPSSANAGGLSKGLQRRSRWITGDLTSARRKGATCRCE